MKPPADLSTRKRKSGCRLFGCSALILAFIPICLLSFAWMWVQLRPQPKPLNQTLYEGITYEREIRSEPRPMVIHTVIVDTKAPGISFLVTPGDANETLPLKARTASQFVSEFDLQIAVNGDGFEPWYSRGFFSYYPHKGDPVAPIGFAASKGNIYSQETDDEPTLYISRTNKARFNSPIGKINNAISGNLMLVAQGKPVIDSTMASVIEGDIPQPRTALAIDKAGRRLIIIVIDGRQPNYSQGATLTELAEILISKGGHFGMNMDGGGSSTLVKAGAAGLSTLINSPIHQNIPLRQRPVGNHLGIYATLEADH